MPPGGAFDTSEAESDTVPFVYHLHGNVEKQVSIRSRQGQHLAQHKHLPLAVEATSVLTFGALKRNLPSCCVEMVRAVVG